MTTTHRGGITASFTAKLERFVKTLSLLWGSPGSRRKAAQLAAARAVVDQVIPASKPLVAAHQRTALMNAQLAAEIGWTGKRGR